MLDCSKTIGKSSKKRKEKGFFNMYKIQLNDRAKENKIAVYYMEDASKLYDLWKDKEERRCLTNSRNTFSTKTYRT